MKIQMMEASKLIPYENNAKLHPPEQIEKLAKEIKECGWTQPIVVDWENVIIAGHGRLLAANKLGLEKVPVHRLSSDIPKERIAAMRLFDNRVSQTDWDYDLLSEEISKLAILDQFTPDLIGFTNDEVFDLLDDNHVWVLGHERSLGEGEGEDEEETRYTDKIKSPIYSPKGERPQFEELFNNSKAEKLKEEIENSSVDEQTKTFLKHAAMRHTVFSYEKIAEFYAHASKEVQELMEKSALVIIDFDKAIELGFVRMTKEIAEVIPDEQ